MIGSEHSIGPALYHLGHLFQQRYPHRSFADGGGIEPFGQDRGRAITTLANGRIAGQLGRQRGVKLCEIIGTQGQRDLRAVQEAGNSGR